MQCQLDFGIGFNIKASSTFNIFIIKHIVFILKIVINKGAFLPGRNVIHAS